MQWFAFFGIFIVFMDGIQTISGGISFAEADLKPINYVSGDSESNSENASISGIPDQKKQVADKNDTSKKTANEVNETYGPNGKKLSDEQKKAVQELKNIDAKVKAHETAHLAAGGGLVRGGATYKYEKGPDGQQYAVAGEVKLDTSADSDKPNETIQKMETVKRAALAPADPSAQDRSVAAAADAKEVQARQDLANQSSQKTAATLKGSAEVKKYKSTAEKSQYKGKNINALVPGFSSGLLLTRTRILHLSK